MIFFPNIYVSNFDSCLFLATGNTVNRIGTHSMLKEAFNFDFILIFYLQLENKMAAVQISYLITHNFLIRPPNFIKFISKCLVLKALEFEVHINLGYQNTLNPKFQASSQLLCLYKSVCVGPVRKPHCWFSHEAAQIIDALYDSES